MLKLFLDCTHAYPGFNFVLSFMNDIAVKLKNFKFQLPSITMKHAQIRTAWLNIV